MTDNVTLNAGAGGETLATDQLAGGEHVQYVKLMDGTLDSSAKIGGDAANGLDVDVTRVGGNVTVVNAGTFAVQATVAAGATSMAKAEDVASADADVGVPAMAVRKGTPANTSGTDGDYEMLQMSAGRLWVDASGKTLTVDASGAAVPVTDNGGNLSIDDGGNNISIDDGGNSITVDGTVGVSGTVTVDSELTTADLDTGAGTDTRAVVGLVLAKSGGGQLTSAGQTLMASSLPVAIASDQSAVPASQSGTWTVQPGNTANTTPWLVSQQPATAGGLLISHLVSGASTNATNVKASAGQLFGWYIYNSNAAARKVALHNTAGTPTAGASVVMSIVIPPTSAANVFTDSGIAFGTGIAFTTVTGLADSDSAAVGANDLVINLFYK